MLGTGVEDQILEQEMILVPLSLKKLQKFRSSISGIQEREK